VPPVEKPAFDLIYLESAFISYVFHFCSCVKFIILSAKSILSNTLSGFSALSISNNAALRTIKALFLR